MGLKPRASAPRTSYLADGHLLEDAKRWGGPALPACQPQVAPEPFSDLLPKDAATSFRVLVGLLTRDGFPGLSCFSPSHRFGLDLRSGSHGWRIGGETWNPTSLRVADDPVETDRSTAVYSLGTDGGGTLFVLLDDGRVGSIDPEGAMLGEIGDTFSSLDEFMWAIVRRSAYPEHRSAETTVRELSSIEGAEPLVDQVVELAEEH